MTDPGLDSTPSRHPTGDRGDDVGAYRALFARLVGVLAVYGAVVGFVLLPLVGFGLIGTIGLYGGFLVSVYVLLSLGKSDYTLYTIRLAIVDAIRAGEWRPR
jgi:hypothetical protein